ncbi:MAG: DNA-processing protein DprA [Planctomycetota bacterium]
MNAPLDPMDSTADAISACDADGRDPARSLAEAPTRITPCDPDWPEALEHVEDPPSALWLRGERRLLSAWPRIAIVGTRAPTPYGEAQARRFAAAFARAGLAVVSGLARGVDSAAHAATLDANGATIAVLGSGVDVPWPTGPTTDAVLARGLVVSEFQLGVRPRRHHFPLRNRIIGALSAAVLVIEAAERSGSLITARFAVDLGLPVFALPGRVDHPMSHGALALIRDGATPVGSPEQLLDDLFGASLTRRASEGHDAQAAPMPPDGTLGRALYLALEGETQTAGELAARAGSEVGPVLAALVDLELDGHVHRAPGGLYSRRR